MTEAYLKRSVSCMNGRGLRLVASAGVAAALAVLLASPLALSAERGGTEEQWTDWRALSQGFIGRAKRPARKVSVEAEAQQVVRLESRPISQLAGLSSGSKPNALRLLGSEEGLYALSVEELSHYFGTAANVVRNKARRGRIQLFSGRVSTPWFYDEKSDQLFFVGTRYDSFYTGTNVYQMRLGGMTFAAPMSVIDGLPTQETGVETPFVDHLTFEEEPDWFYSLWSVPYDADADYWIWDYLQGGSKDSIEVTLEVPHPAPTGTARIEVLLRGASDLVPGDDHHVHAELNGIAVGDTLSWDGLNPAVLSVEFDQSLLAPTGDNILRLRNDYPVGTTPMQFLDSIEISYSRKPVAVGGQLLLHEVAADVQTVTGFQSADILVIESPLSRAALRQDARVEANGSGGYAVTFRVTGGQDYLVVERGQARTAQVEIDEPSNLRSATNEADYLIIAPKAFEQTALSLADYRNLTFGTVTVAWLQDIYDEFSFGRTDPHAIERFMGQVEKHWQKVPSTVMLIGNGTLDHKDRMQYGDSFLPIRFTHSPWALAASDERLLGFDGDAPFTIGRLPITSDAEGLAYVQKLIDHESSAGNGQDVALLAADDSDPDAGDFHDNIASLAERLRNQFGFDVVSELYHPSDDVRGTLISSAAWQAADVVVYDGHGHTTGLGTNAEGFMKVADAQALSNTHYPLFTALTCAAGNFTQPGVRSLAGTLVLNPSGGAIAAMVPTDLSLDDQAEMLGNDFMDSLYGDNATVGDALQKAKLISAGSVDPFMRHIYTVLGEPAVFGR